MTRVFCPEIKAGDKNFTINDVEQVRHLKTVLRVKEGEPLELFNGRGYECRCLVSAVGPYSVTVTVIASLQPDSRRIREVAVACAIPKQTKMDDVIDKLTQLGVQRIIPMVTERVIVRLDPAKSGQRHQRWEKIALSAVKQSQRNDLAVVEEVRSFAQVLEDSSNYRLKLIPALIGDRRMIKEVVSGAGTGPALILIGPEGDFTPEELEAALAKGFIPVSLGDTVLRVDTAAIAAAAYLIFSS